MPNEKVKLIPTVNLQTQGFQENTACAMYAPFMKDYEVIHDHSHNKEASFYLKQNDLIDKVAYLPTVHNMATIPYPMRKPSVVCLSRAHADWIESRFGYKCRYVYNGVDPAQFRPVLKWKLKGDRYVTVGRPNSEKNMLEAVDICKEGNLPLDVVAGRLSIEPTDYAVKLAQSCLFGTPWHYSGQLSNEEKNRLVSRAKATLITYGGRDSRAYYVEPFGLVAAESLLCGTPVVTYDCGALKEIVRDGVDGFVIPRPNFDDKDDVARAHTAFIKALHDVESLDLNEIYFNAKQQWSYKRMCDDYVKLYESVVKGECW